MELRTILLGFFTSAALASAAFGADNLPAAITKAPAIIPSTSGCQVPTATLPLSCSGAYVGVGLGGAGSNANIIGSGVNGSVFAGGITPTVDAGYLYAQGNWVFGAENDLGYSVNTNAAANGVGNNFNGLRVTQDFKVGGNLAGMLGTQQPITIPASLQSAIIAPYVHTGVSEWQLPGSWATANESGAGVLFDFPPIGGHAVFGDFRYTYTNFNGAKAGGITIQNDQSLLFQVNWKLN